MFMIQETSDVEVQWKHQKAKQKPSKIKAMGSQKLEINKSGQRVPTPAA